MKNKQNETIDECEMLFYKQLDKLTEKDIERLEKNIVRLKEAKKRKEEAIKRIDGAIKIWKILKKRPKIQHLKKQIRKQVSQELLLDIID